MTKFSKYALALGMLATESASGFVTVPKTPASGVAFHHKQNYVNELSHMRSASSSALFGIMDEVNSDAFNLFGNTAEDLSDPQSDKMKEAYEMFLGELVFSANDPRLDIVENAEKSMDEGFLSFLNKKVQDCSDVEEKMALRDLYEMILDIKEKLELSEQAAQRELEEKEKAEQKRLEEAEKAAAAGKALSDTDVLRKANVVNTAEIGISSDALGEDGTASEGAGGTKKSFIDSDLSPEIRLSYDKLVKKLHPPYKPGQTVQDVVKVNYDQCDAQLVKVLNERAENGDTDSQMVLDTLAMEQQNQVQIATEKLKTVLAAGDPMRMEGVIVKLAKEGQIDEPFLLLLEANADQARKAGATGPADLMMKLKERAITEKDKQSTSKQIRLLRQLLREEDKVEREKLLEDAFTPRETFLVPGTAENAAKAADGEQPEEEKPMPDVSPPDFINACKAVLINFGNLGTDEKGDLTAQVKMIASEAEVIATRIYGQGMSVKEQQDRMWKEQTTSIFDLETLEIEAESMGEKVPWGREDGDDILPGFDADGRMKVGGG